MNQWGKPNEILMRSAILQMPLLRVHNLAQPSSYMATVMLLPFRYYEYIYDLTLYANNYFLFYGLQVSIMYQNTQNID